MNMNHECRFCLMNEKSTSNPFISPCKCTGSGKYVHRLCLSKWRKTDLRLNQELTCPICLSNYDSMLVSQFEIIPKYTSSRFISMLLNSHYCIIILNSCFILYNLHVNIQMADCDTCTDLVMHNFNKPFIVSHYLFANIYFCTYLNYFLRVNNKLLYLSHGWPFIWIPILHCYLLSDLTQYYYIFSFIHHHLLPCYLLAHANTLRLVNDNL